MSNWDRTEEYAQRSESTSQWVKLSDDGDRAVVVFLGEPHPREVVFDAGGYHPFTQEHAAKGLKPTVRFPINVAVLPEFEVKVMEVGMSLMRDVLKVKKKYGLEGWAYEVTRRGAAKDPKTSYDLLPEKQLTTDEQRRCSGLQLHDLAELYEGRSGSSTVASTPIDEKTAKEIVDRLRALPRAIADEWLHEMRVIKVRELTTDKLKEARALLDKLENANSGDIPF